MAVSVSAVRVSWDSGYDRASRSLAEVACSDGKTGLMPKYQKQGDLRNFPNIGGTDAIAGWGSTNCGSCYKLQYNGASIKVLAIDHAGSGFNIGQTAMNALTNGRAVEFGQVDATVTRLTPKDCGL
ncbi:secreted insect toxic protein [Metarhizium rileyi]|nr:secreted insect toxic protein [Metarhizium rileyi RCEF 4871]